MHNQAGVLFCAFIVIALIILGLFWLFSGRDCHGGGGHKDHSRRSSHYD